MKLTPKNKNPKKVLKPIQFTQEGYDQLKLKFDELTQERKGAVETLAAARAMGDLSENGLYTAAKARLRSIDSQLFQLEMQMKLGYVQDAPTDRIGIGSKVTVEVNNKKRDFQLVGGYESDPLSGKITTNSPIGRALLGKKIGDQVEVEVPAGKTVYKIVKISK